jgi:hypothetical protein
MPLSMIAAAIVSEMPSGTFTIWAAGARRTAA